MNKNANFTGQPIFSQLLNLIDKSEIKRQVKYYQSDKYYKKFKTYEHLVTMLYTIYHKCSSIREVVSGMQVCCKKLNHLGMVYCPRKSTLSQANQKRNTDVFKSIYKVLYTRYSKSLPDSRKKKSWYSRLYIIDSTTITLFKEILKNAGRNPINGKRKGGIKVHALIKADQDIPCLIKMNAASSHDIPFIKGLKLPKGSIVVFDKAYNDYSQYELWTEQKVDWVTRLRQGSVYQVIEDKPINTIQFKKGVIKECSVILGHTSHTNITRTKARLIEYYDIKTQRTFSFITNNQTLAASTIAEIYKHRWQIEILFKRLKQNYPIQYFLGDNENAIKIQIWCALIADLLLKVVISKVKRKWSYANLSSLIRIHLMTYTKLFAFLENPDKQLINYRTQHNKGPTLFDMGYL